MDEDADSEFALKLPNLLEPDGTAGPVLALWPPNRLPPAEGAGTVFAHGRSSRTELDDCFGGGTEPITPRPPALGAHAGLAVSLELPNKPQLARDADPELVLELPNMAELGVCVASGIETIAPSPLVPGLPNVDVPGKSNAGVLGGPNAANVETGG